MAIPSPPPPLPCSAYDWKYQSTHLLSPCCNPLPRPMQSNGAGGGGGEKICSCVFFSHESDIGIKSLYPPPLAP